MSVVHVVHAAVVRERFPQHVTGLLRVTSDASLIVKADAVEEIVGRIGHVGGLRAATHAIEYWRGVYQKMGAKPKYRPSVQLLLDTYEERGRIVVPVPLVELYCWYSLARGVPMAGYRPEAIEGSLRLMVPGKGRPFTPLGQPKAQPEMTKSGEIAYVDDAKTICRYWNNRDCDQTKLVPGVCDALFVFDLVEGNGLPSGEQAVEVMSTFVTCLAGNVRTMMAVLDGQGSSLAEL
jgi:DNA/RNA-binding domain of Phe-tRNA-synthetase-like protein